MSSFGPSDYSDLGQRLLAAGEYEKAGAAFYECLKREPAAIGAALGLATASRELGKLDIAIKVLETARRFSPRDIRLLVTLGAALQESGRAADAIEVLERARVVEPTSVEALFNLANALQDSGRTLEAEVAYRDALALRPDDGDARTNLIRTLMKGGKVEAMERELWVALKTEPTNLTLIRLLLFVMMYVPGHSEDDIAGLTRKAIAGLTDSGATARLPVSADTTLPLRIGVLSGDLRHHPVGRNLISIVERLDRARFSLVFFSDTPAADAMTKRFQACAVGWHETRGLADIDLAEKIRWERIDILLILAARFDENRVVFGLQRAAPIQIALHDVATSGLPNIDHLVLDRFLVPRPAMAAFTERVIRLPSFYIHAPLEAPPVGPLPMAGGEGITFGCLNNPFKLNDQVLTLWAQLLAEIPAARLLLSYKQTYASGDLQRRIRAPFERRGIAPERLLMLAERRSTAEYLELYNRIDVALDPFPFSGSTTSFEALWMGVPVVTWAGQTAASRWTGSMLHALKLDDFIADSDEAYIALARAWIGRPGELTALRASLRDRLRQSPLCDANRRARQMERLFTSFMS